MPSRYPDVGPDDRATFAALLDDAEPRVARALHAAHDAYARLGVRHALVGALALRVHGVRREGGVEFLVGSEAFETTGTLVSFRAGLPLASEGVPIDSILAPDAYTAVLEDALDRPVAFDGVPVARAEHLLFMKLVAGERQDVADASALLHAGDVDEARARVLFAAAKPAIRATFERLLAEIARA